ncbi:MAG: radical SAM protein [Lachnospiraceae bacterium]|nr:radical SAM protein [Lachnospiraceae bacterium]
MFEFSRYTHIMPFDKYVIVCNVRTGSYMRVPKSYYNLLKDSNLDEMVICNHADLQKVFNNLIQLGCIDKKSTIAEKDTKKVDMIYFSITNKCNLKCIHCCTDAISNYSEELSEEDVLSIIDKIITLNPKTLCITGGEPLMRQNFFNILERIRGKFQGKIVLSTNGTLINPSNVEHIIKNVDSISISLDGYDEESCSVIRGSGVFSKCCKTIELLHEHGFKKISLSMIVTKHTTEKRENFERLCEKYEAEPLFRILEPLGRGEEIYQELKGDMVGKHDEISLGCRVCFPGFKELHINYNGKVYPCGGTVGIDEFVITNAKNEDFVQVIQEFLKESELPCISPYRSWNCKSCKDCSIQLFCPLCIGEKYVLLQQGNLEEEFCSRYRERIAKAMKEELYG